MAEQNPSNTSEELEATLKFFDSIPTSMAEQNPSNTSEELEATLKFFDSCPPGMRFYPTDSELILHYLQPKINGFSLHKNMIIHRVNIYRHNPDSLTGTYVHSWLNVYMHPQSSFMFSNFDSEFCVANYENLIVFNLLLIVAL